MERAKLDDKKVELSDLLKACRDAVISNTEKMDYIERTTGLKPRENEDDLNKVVFLTLLQVNDAPRKIQLAFTKMFMQAT